MAPQDYQASTTGALKLKGAPAGITKKRKKKPKPPTGDAAAAQTEKADDEVREEAEEEKERAKAPGRPETSQKTEAERRHEEMKRRRLDDRLKREGTKTHKERVEELNTYLSKLSEHHDMPRIGPG